jgi:hypothetical protein
MLRAKAREMNLFGGSFVKPFRNVSRNTYVDFVWLGVARLHGFFSKLLRFQPIGLALWALKVFLKNSCGAMIVCCKNEEE